MTSPGPCGPCRRRSGWWSSGRAVPRSSPCAAMASVMASRPTRPITTSRVCEPNQSPATARQRPLVDRKQLALGARCVSAGRRPPLPGEQRRPNPGHPPQPGHQCPAARWNLVDHRGHRRPGSRHQGLTQAAGVARAHDGSELLGMTSHRPWGLIPPSYTSGDAANNCHE